VVLRADSTAATADEVVARRESDAPQRASALGSGGGCEEEVLRDELVALVRALVCRGGHHGARACARDDLFQATPPEKNSVGVQDHDGDAHGLCEEVRVSDDRDVIAAQDGSQEDSGALWVVSVSATRRVEMQVGAFHAYDRGEVGCHHCYC
jgi:hypothetical protein